MLFKKQTMKELIRLKGICQRMTESHLVPEEIRNKYEALNAEIIRINGDKKKLRKSIQYYSTRKDSIGLGILRELKALKI